jgi:hypothetical protein
MRNALGLFLPVVSALLLAACGGGPKVPDWKKDSVNLIEKYKLAELKGQNLRAERYFEQALAAAGSAGRLNDTARLHLVRCATRQASLAPGVCEGYLQHARHETTADDEHYHRFLSGQWDQVDSGKLPSQYREFIKADTPAMALAATRAMQDPLSRLIAVSLMLARKQVDDDALTLAAETASEQGWRKPLLVYLKLLQNRVEARGNQQEAEKLRARIRLVEDSMQGTQ